jgi:hypothetical protein
MSMCKIDVRLKWSAVVCLRDNACVHPRFALREVLGKCLWNCSTADREEARGPFIVEGTRRVKVMMTLRGKTSSVIHQGQEWGRANSLGWFVSPKIALHSMETERQG